MADYSDKDPYVELVQAFRDERDPDRKQLADASREVEKFICTICKKYPDLVSQVRELTQDTISRAYEKIGGFKWKSQFMTWVKGIAVNVVREHIRKKDNQNVSGADVYLERALAEEADPEDQALRHLVYEDALKQLDDDEKHAIQIRFTDAGLVPFHDVGAKCGISPVEAQRLVYRALPKIKRYWTENNW